ncbi:MAG: hypothetical protein ACETWQ_07375 [Phycisphaerae bacterium]
MKQMDNILYYSNSVSRADENISRLVKLADNSSKPCRAFTESLINNALGKLEQLKTARKREELNIIMKVSWWEKAMGLAAMIAVVCLAGFSILVSNLNSFFAVIVLTVMFINRFIYLGGLIL